MEHTEKGPILTYMDHAPEILEGLLVPVEHPPTFLKPVDQTLDGVAVTAGVFFEHDRSRVTILVRLARDRRRDAQVQQVVEHLGLVHLPGAEVGVQRVPFFVAYKVDFADQSAPAAAKGVALGLVVTRFLPPPGAHLCARTAVRSFSDRA